MIKTIAIDMIGVLINETRIVSNRLYNMLENKPISKERLKENYDNVVSVGKLTTGKFWGELFIANWEEYEYKFLFTLNFNNDSRSFLEKYSKRLNFILVTDLPTRWAEIILKQRNIYQYFSRLICGDTINGSKKDGGSYAQLLKNNSMEEIIVIDDSLSHIQTAANMGFDVIHFANEKSSDSEYMTIGNFLDLGSYLSKCIGD